MKSAALLKAVYLDCKNRGYVQVGDNLYPPSHPAALKAMEVKSKRKPRTVHIKTADIHDTRNIKNKLQRDTFTMLMEKEGLDCWPEYFFSTERLYRFDYALPEYKIAVEQNGGIHMRGNSGHSSGTGIQRDMDKNALASSLGWTVISRAPEQMLTSATIDLIRKIIANKMLI